MILHGLPTLTNNEPRNGILQAIERQNVLFHSRNDAAHYCPIHESPFGLTVSLEGTCSLRINRKMQHVRQGQFFVVNRGTQFGIETGNYSCKEALMLFFKREQLIHIADTHRIPPNQLIDDPVGKEIEDEFFTERMYAQEGCASHLFDLLKQMDDQNRIYKENSLDVIVYDVLEYLMRLNSHTAQEINSLKNSKAVTRKELYKRLHSARDFMEASYAENITLEDIAQVACINPYYFLRLFKELFRQTPHSYLTSVRMNHACRLLSSTNMQVTEICQAVGFVSIHSFCHLFKRRYGMPPSNFRNSH